MQDGAGVSRRRIFSSASPAVRLFVQFYLMYGISKLVSVEDLFVLQFPLLFVCDWYSSELESGFIAFIIFFCTR